MRYKIPKIINNRSTLYLVLSIVLVSVLSLTIVYAALATTNQPTITDNTKVIFSADLQTPGEYYSFTGQVLNLMKIL